MIGIPSMLAALAPLWIVAGATMVLLLADTLMMRVGATDKERELGTLKGSLLSSLTAFVLAIAFAVSALNFQFETRLIATSASMLVVDSQASFAMALLSGGGLLTLWLSLGALPAVRLHFGEFYPLLLFSLAGAMALVCAANLIMLFVAIELMSLPFYVLAGFDRERKRSNQAGVDAFLSGGFSSALTLYGIALLYGATGHFDYPGIHAAMDANREMAFAGTALVLVGLLTRIGAFPFHQWSTGVTAGAPVAITMFIPVSIFGASAFALTRIFEALVETDRASMHMTIAIFATASMLVGAGMALRETNVKRMFAYAAVAHAGFLLVALSVPDGAGRFAALLEIATFVVAQVGALGVVAAIATSRSRWENISDYNGLAVDRPILAAAMTILLLALAGAPTTSGFVSRLSVIWVAVGDGQILITFSIGLASVMLFAAYLRIASAMYMSPSSVTDAEPPPFMATIAIGLCVIITVYLGIFPGQGPFGVDFLEIVRRAAHVS